MTFHMCENEESPCVFPKESFEKLKPKTDGIRRCIRHNSPVSRKNDAKDREAARKWAKETPIK